MGLQCLPFGHWNFNIILKVVNGYSNIRIRSEYSNTISEFEYTEGL